MTTLILLIINILFIGYMLKIDNQFKKLVYSKMLRQQLINDQLKKTLEAYEKAILQLENEITTIRDN